MEPLTFIGCLVFASIAYHYWGEFVNERAAHGETLRKLHDVSRRLEYHDPDWSCRYFVEKEDGSLEPGELMP